VLHQHVRIAILDYAPVLQHDNAIEAAQSRQAMGNRHHRPSAHQALERVADHLLGFDIERRGGLIQQQDRRVLQKGAPDGNALPLATRQLDAPIANDRGKALGQRCDELIASRAAAASSTSASDASGRP
jgi:hypothetical protein